MCPGQPELTCTHSGKRMLRIAVCMCSFGCEFPTVSSKKGEHKLILAVGFRGRVKDIL